MEVFLNDDVVASTALANLFMTLSDGKVNLVGIKSIGQQTEEAFLDLVEQEESRGFARIYKQEAA
jgi:ABC-2 type transport system ATP-binding protein